MRCGDGGARFIGPARVKYPLPYLPVSNPRDLFSTRLDAYSLFVQHEVSNVKYAAKLPNGRVIRGELDQHGRTQQLYGKASEKLEVLVGQSLGEWGMITEFEPNTMDDGDAA